jgi:hypothetical protein
MIGRQRAVARRQRRAAEMAELLGMQLDRQAQRPRDVEHPRDLAVSKAMPSQKPSTASTSPRHAPASSAGRQTSSI